MKHANLALLALTALVGGHLASASVLHGQASTQTFTIPVSYIRRAESVMTLFKHAGIAIDRKETRDNAYPDIIDGEWYTPYILSAIALGMIEVDAESGLVHPYRSVSRAEYLKMMTIAFGLTTNIPHKYSDVSESVYEPYAGLSYTYKLFKGKDDFHLDPKARVTHAQALEAVRILLTAEPLLQPQPGMFQTHRTVKVSSLKEASRKLAQSYISLSTPNLVKSAMLKLIRRQSNSAESTKLKLIARVNQERATFGLPPLKANYYLEKSAQDHAKDMAFRGYFSHYTPEGRSYVDRIKGAGYLTTNPDACSCTQEFRLGTPKEYGPNYQIVGSETCDCEPRFSMGENIARGQLTVDEVMNDWMNSPNHRKNILRPEFEEIGLGIFEDVWAQNFGALKFE